MTLQALVFTLLLAAAPTGGEQESALTIVEEMRGRVESVVQHDGPLRITPSIDCGIHAMAAVQIAFGQEPDWDRLNQLLRPQRTGATVEQLVRAAEQLGLHAVAVRLEQRDLARLRYPAVLHVRKSTGPAAEPNHFVVVLPATEPGVVYVDPPKVAEVIDPARVARVWDGVAVIMSPTPFRAEDAMEAPMMPRVLSGLAAAGVGIGLCLAGVNRLHSRER